MSKLHPDRVEIGSMTTTQRNALSSPPTGTMIYNTSTTQVELWTGTQWLQVSNNPFSASGGNESTAGGYKYHTFTAPGTLILSGSKDLEVLIVGAGGCGREGGGAAGGGGAARSGRVKPAAVRGPRVHPL